jgi:hypothetical protein
LKGENVTKRILTGGILGILVLFLSAGLGLAGNGKIGNGTGISIVCAGTPVEITGTVSVVAYNGSGMVVSQEDGSDVTIYGIGPYWYWESLGMEPPEVGEAVTVSGMEVDFNGTLRIVARSLTVDGGTAELREACVDGSGGQPLWRGLRQNQRQ